MNDIIKVPLGRASSAVLPKGLRTPPVALAWRGFRLKREGTGKLTLRSKSFRAAEMHLPQGHLRTSHVCVGNLLGSTLVIGRARSKDGDLASR
jgi:hypothetical protein